MRVVLFGATGMVGQGVLHECLAASDVEQVLAIGRTSTNQTHPKLQDLIQSDLYNYSDIAETLAGFDACFFCLGVSSVGMSEEQYSRITYDLTMAAAAVLSQQNPSMTFVYVSGTGTDSSENGNSMWAKVKGKTENALFRMPFTAAYAFRPGFIEAVHGETSKTKLYKWLYPLLKVSLPVLRALFPKWILTTKQIGLAMLNSVRTGYPKQVLEINDIRILASAQNSMHESPH